MNRAEVLDIVKSAREKVETPDLRGADLRGADLTEAELVGVNLRGANLMDTYLMGANLSGANLQDVNLTYANLRGANLSYATWNGFRIDGLPSQQVTLTPTPEGWNLRVNHWQGTPDQLRDLITKDEGLPESMGVNITHHRPYLKTALMLCVMHMKDNSDYIKELKDKWGD